MIRRLLMLWACCAGLAQAEGIAVIDVEAVLAASNQAQTARAQWQQALAPIEQDIARLVQQGQQAEDELMAATSDAQRQDLRRRLDELRQQVRSLQQQAQSQLTELENAFLAEQLPILERLVIELADENQVDLVVRAEAVVWGRASVNLSDDLLARYNQP